MSKLRLGPGAPDVTTEQLASWGRYPEGNTMNIIQKPSPNFGYPQGAHGRGGEAIQAIVCHIMGGSLAGCDAWFQNPTSQVSAHYGVGKDGSVHQYVADADAAWGAGILNHPDASLPWLAPSGGTVNRRVLSIEHEGQPGDVFSPAQLAATIALHQALVTRYGIPVDRLHIVGHYRLDSINRARCPGPGFPWDALFAALAAPAGPTPEQEWANARDVLKGWSHRLPQIAAEIGQSAPWAGVVGELTEAGKEIGDVRSIVERLHGAGKT